MKTMEKKNGTSLLQGTASIAMDFDQIGQLVMDIGRPQELTNQ